MPAKAYPKKFSVSHLRGAKFARRGLRSYFEYRDLGIKRATRGGVVAHVIRARPQKAPHGEWHAHDCKVQFVYVLLVGSDWMPNFRWYFHVLPMVVLLLQEGLFPEGGLQERNRNFSEFFLSAGPGLLGALLEDFEPLGQDFSIFTYPL